MKVYTFWIFIFGYLINHCVRSEEADFEVFQAAPNDQRSQSLYPESEFNVDNFFNNDFTKKLNKRYTKVNVANLKPVAPKPPITDSVFYVSPRDVEKRISRSPQDDEGNKHSSYEDGYQEFLAKYFADPVEENAEPKSASGKAGTNSRYQQSTKTRDVEDIGESRGKGSHDDSDGTTHDDEYERIKLLSQKQEEEIKQNPKHCKVTVKGNMRCSICKNPKSGAHSESCSFSSTDEPKKYAYTKERNYNSKDDEGDDEDDGEEEEAESENSEDTQKSENKKSKIISTTTIRSIPTRRVNRLRVATSRSPIFEAPTRGPALRRSQPLRNPRTNSTKFSATYQAAESRQIRQVVGLDPFLYGGDDDDSKKNKSQEYRLNSYDDYFAHVFPDSKNGRFEQLKKGKEEEDSDDVEFLPNYDTKQNVEKVLAEFKKKDWSTCDKKLKGDLTCYQCKDERGVRHEECIYISHPKTSRLTYSELKEYNDPEENRKEELTDEDAENHSSDLVTDKSIIPDTQSKRKLKRKLVVRKRKTKLGKPESTTTRSSIDNYHGPNPQDIADQRGNEKQTIKRTISYRIENNNEQVPAESRVMVYEHRVSHVL